ncbi:MAG: ATP-binding protein [Arenicellales bacterium]
MKFKSASLQTRLLLTASIILTVFLGLTGVALFKAFQSSAEQAEQGKLEGQLYGLLGAAELDSTGDLVMANDLAEPRFSIPESGLVAEIVDDQGKTEWQSVSTLGMKLPPQHVLAVDESRFQRLSINNNEWFSFSYGIVWVDEQEIEHRYSFRVMESPQAFNQQAERFRRTLIVWLTAAALILLVVQVMVLRWSLRPLRRIEAEVHQVERGEREQLTEDYPRELNGLAGSLNLLLTNERRHLQRYRNTLADLAHSIKTPLAVLRGVADSSTDKECDRHVIEEEVGRMDHIVEYQLQKAATAGSKSLTSGIAILPVAERLLASLQKVYQDKSISYSMDIDNKATFMGEKGDLMEVIGNLLDNASKWCRSTVTFTVKTQKSETATHERHVIIVEDDGPGMAENQIEKLLQRGARGDEQTPGHGIGLAVVREIVEAYGGELTITRSQMGGAKVEVLI